MSMQTLQKPSYAIYLPENLEKKVLKKVVVFCIFYSTQKLPEHVEDLSVWFDSEEDVWHSHVLELSFFGIGKIDFRFPDSLR